jgi:hypothetical protein
MSERIEGSTVNEIVLASAMSGLSHRRSMMFKTNRYNEQFHVGDDGPSPGSASTLVPMLVGGLGLIVVGMIAVGIFVG